MLVGLGHNDNVEQLYRRAIAMNSPTASLEADIRYGILLKKQGRLSEATKMIRTAMMSEHQATSMEAALRLAALYEEREQYAEALECFMVLEQSDDANQRLRARERILRTQL